MIEITRKVRIGKWQALSVTAPNLAALAYLQRPTLVPLDAAIRAMAGSMISSHKDPFDRLIAATALHLGCPLVSSDAAFDAAVSRIW
jgi:PIN domain nuclease of toxin-antitoxin system